MIVHNVSQGTDAWRELRAGIPTASAFDRIMTPGGKDGKPKLSESRQGYLCHLLAERILHQPLEADFQSEDMARGNEFEAQAVAAYEFQNDCETVRVGFVTNFDGMVGCSPDRFIVTQPAGALEIKCPKAATHVGYMLAAQGAGKKYQIQVQGQLWVCEREWVDIMSYHPGMPEAQYRVYRDEEFIKELAAHVLSFARELEDKSGEFAEKGWIKPLAEEQAEGGIPSLGITDEDIARILAAQKYLHQETK